MPKPPRRNFGISDAMILVVATALAAAATRHRWAPFVEWIGPGGMAYRETFADFTHVLKSISLSFSFFTSTWSLACLILGLRHPRRRSRLLFRQPGLVACLATAVVLGFKTIGLAIKFSMQDGCLDGATFDDRLDVIEATQLIPPEIGCAVTAAWVVQWASGRWRPEAHWIDRLGRALGLLWMATIPLSLIS